MMSMIKPLLYFSLVWYVIRRLLLSALLLKLDLFSLHCSPKENLCSHIISVLSADNMLIFVSVSVLLVLGYTDGNAMRL